MAENKPLLAIIGPTGAGKSALALGLAEALGRGEILSCDSVQVYRGFDIGSAKPTREEQARIPHHLIDLCSWDEPFDAQQFRARAIEAQKDCRERKGTPILCGGTGLYLRLLRWGMADVPGADPVLRAEFAQWEAADPGALVRMLLEGDPEAGLHVDLKNPRRVIRALEIFRQSGLTPSRLREEHGFAEEEVPMEVVVLDWDPVLLRQRIGARLLQMQKAGWLSEVAGLLKAGVSRDCPGMSAVGYREMAAHLAGELCEGELVDRIEKSTWAYAKRQRTWMRKEKGTLRVELGSEREFDQIRVALMEGVSRGESVGQVLLRLGRK